MSDNITPFPGRKIYPRTVSPKEMYAQAKPSDEMIWAICPWLKVTECKEDVGCYHCPEWENDEDHGKIQRMCYGLASETCQIVFAMQAREKK